MSAAPLARSGQCSWLAPLLVVALLVLIVAGVLWFAANSLLAGLCDSTEIARLPAPDGRHDVVLFEHNCGTTTDFATHVSVLPAGAPLGNDPGNAFAAEAGDAGQRAAWGGPEVEVAWIADGSLAIHSDAAAKVFHIAEVVEGVPIAAIPAPQALSRAMHPSTRQSEP